MFIQTEATPNPATLKFLPGRDVLSQGTREFRDPAEATAVLREAWRRSAGRRPENGQDRPRNSSTTATSAGGVSYIA